MTCQLGTKRNYEKLFLARVTPKSQPISFVNISFKLLKRVNTVGSGKQPLSSTVTPFLLRPSSSLSSLTDRDRQLLMTKVASVYRECPDGGDKCKYRHALPPGFVLKSQKKKEEADAKKQEISLEEFLEVEVSPPSFSPSSSPFKVYRFS